MLQMYHAVMRFSLNKGEQAHVSFIDNATRASLAKSFTRKEEEARIRCS